MTKSRDVCLKCAAGLACVAGVAQHTFACRTCGKTVVRVRMYRGTIEIGEKPAECKLIGLGQAFECSPCFLDR